MRSTEEWTVGSTNCYLVARRNIGWYDRWSRDDAWLGTSERRRNIRANNGRSRGWKLLREDTGYRTRTDGRNGRKDDRRQEPTFGTETDSSRGSMDGTTEGPLDGIADGTKEGVTGGSYACSMMEQPKDR